MSKFLLNLLLHISKALVNSKIQFLIWKFFFLISARPTLRPTRPLAQPAHWSCRPHRPKPSSPAHPALASVASSREIRLPVWFTPSEPAASPTSLCQPGPRCQFHSPPPAARACPTSSTPRVPPDRYHLAFISPPLNPLLNPPIFNGVKAINAGIKLLGHPSPALPRPPIKGEHPHRVSPHLSPLLFPSLHA
jgi:hypothetical protein